MLKPMAIAPITSAPRMGSTMRRSLDDLRPDGGVCGPAPFGGISAPPRGSSSTRTFSRSSTSSRSMVGVDMWAPPLLVRLALLRLEVLRNVRKNVDGARRDGLQRLLGRLLARLERTGEHCLQQLRFALQRDGMVLGGHSVGHEEAAHHRTDPARQLLHGEVLPQQPVFGMQPQIVVDAA